MSRLATIALAAAALLAPSVPAEAVCWDCVDDKCKIMGPNNGGKRTCTNGQVCGQGGCVKVCRLYGPECKGSFADPDQQACRPEESLFVPNGASSPAWGIEAPGASVRSAASSVTD